MPDVAHMDHSLIYSSFGFCQAGYRSLIVDMALSRGIDRFLTGTLSELIFWVV
jgi:hypothetical protein